MAKEKDFISLSDCKKTLNELIEDSSYRFKKAKVPKVKRSSAASVRFYSSVLHHLEKEVSNG